MEKELDIKVQIAEIIKDNATINGLTKYFEMDQDNINDAVAEIFEALIWHGPDVVPPTGEWNRESIKVVNQGDESVFYDFHDKEWYDYNNQCRVAHVEKWRYPEPIKR